MIHNGIRVNAVRYNRHSQGENPRMLKDLQKMVNSQLKHCILPDVISLVADMVIIRRRDAKRWKNDYLVKGVSLPPLAYN